MRALDAPGGNGGLVLVNDGLVYTADKEFVQSFDNCPRCAVFYPEPTCPANVVIPEWTGSATATCASSVGGSSGGLFSLLG